MGFLAEQMPEVSHLRGENEQRGARVYAFAPLFCPPR